MKAFLTSSPLLALGKVCFEAALLAPMVMLMLMSTKPTGIEVTFIYVIGLGMGNMITCMIAGIFIFLFVEHPLRRIL
jgi:hypothetical protein